jgi:class 3 adenylate cyclase
MAICARCGAESPEGFRFCGACGAALDEAPAPRQARKIVTSLFCDVTGSTALGEELDPEVLRGVLNRYFAEIRGIIERHGGTVEKFIGDAVMAVFGIPRVYEDDALRAVRAAAEIRKRLPAVAKEVGVELRFRTGLNTGPVLMGEGENLAIGDAINVAARLEQAAEPGEIVISEETLALVRDAVRVEALKPLELKGKSERVAAFRLVSVDPVASGISRHLDSPLVGRKHELRRLREAWDEAVEDPRCQLFTLLGAAGVGKSRLVAELLSEVSGQAFVLRGRCLHYGEGITFWPLVEALMPAGESATAVIERLSGGSAAIAEELFWDVRRLLESLAAERPVLLYLDDLQWAEPMLLDLLDHVADLSRGAAILLLCTARPELLDERPGWGGGKLNATTLLLEPLASSDSEALLDALGDGLDRDARARVIAASEGNPLFLEEMAALARERGTVEIPPTIHALLCARLEQLAIEERELLERGAVEGEVFHRLVVKALAGDRLGPEVERRLAGLVRKELIRPHPATFRGDEAFRFRHLLIRDAAYDTLPKATRADLHERFADWLEENATDLLELDEIAGWHLEQAVRYRRELGQEADPRLAARAVGHLHVAGRRATERRDTSAARNLLERALALTAPGDSRHAQVALALAEAAADAGEYEGLEELLAAATDPETAPVANLVRLQWLSAARPDQFFNEVDGSLPAATEELERRGDARGLAKAHWVAHIPHLMACQATPMAEELRIAAE